MSLSFLRRGTVGALLLAGTLALPACASSAQTPEGRTEQRGDRLERQVAAIHDAVGLSDQQTSQIRTLLEARSADMRGPRGSGQRGSGQTGQQGAGRPPQNDPQRAERMAETERQIEAVMTPEQVTRYRAWRETQRSQRGARGQGGPRN